MQKKYKTPAAFARAVERYFNSIRVVQPLIVAELDPKQNEDGSYYATLDAFGHPMNRYVQKLAEDGKRALFILDEPTSGLHSNEVALLLAALFRLRDAGHPILCVEHHKDLLNAADYLVDMGPGAGRHGGNIVAEGSPADVASNPESPTSPWLVPR